MDEILTILQYFLLGYLSIENSFAVSPSMIIIACHPVQMPMVRL